jgi:hypothetical protein
MGGETMMAAQRKHDDPMPIQHLKALQYNLTATRGRRNWMLEISKRLGEWAYAKYEPAPQCLQGCMYTEMSDPHNKAQLVAWREWVDDIVLKRRQNHANLQTLLQCVRICGEVDEDDSEDITRRLEGLRKYFLDFLEQEWGIERGKAEKLQRPHNFAKNWAYNDLSKSVDTKWLVYDEFMLKKDG